MLTIEQIEKAYQLNQKRNEMRKAIIKIASGSYHVSEIDLKELLNSDNIEEVNNFVIAKINENLERVELECNKYIGPVGK